jgi:hypothetical protein
MSVSAIPAAGVRRDRLFYAAMAVAMAATAFAGFAPTYFLKAYFATPPLNTLLHVHGLAFSTWMVLFFTQTVLIVNKRPDIHRRLGVAGAVLAVGMVMLGIAAAVWSIRAGHTPPGIDPRAFLVLPFFDLSLFVILVAAGLSLRRHPEAHKRLMLLGTLALLGAATGRIAVQNGLGLPIGYALQDAFLVAGVAYDLYSRRRVHPAYLWGGLLLVASQPLRLVVSHTPVWLAFGDWVKG